MSSPFTPKSLSFLRALKRHNDREWFRARKADYEQHVRAPLVELLARLARDMTPFAPELVSDPKVSLFRIYRDTRFSSNKAPLKTQAGAHFPARGAARGQGAGLYVEFGPDGVWMGGGIYMPEAAQLRAIRAHIAATHPRLHRLATARPFVKAVGGLQGEQLSRVPRGYDAGHPAAAYLQFKQFLGGCDRDPAFVYHRFFYRDLLATFRAVAPLVRFLNTALTAVPDSEPAAPTAVVLVDAPRPEPMW